MTDVHVILPGDIDDPLRPSGGNHYDRRICRELAQIGWTVHEHPVPGGWPAPDTAARVHLSQLLGSLPDRSLVLADGLVASAAPAQLLPQSRRLRLVVLVHMLLGDGAEYGGHDSCRAERTALSAATALVVTSQWTRRRLQRLYSLPAERVRVVEPGVTLADPAPGTADGGAILCVASVTPGKGHDVLIAALAMVRDLAWRCDCVGSLDLQADLVDDLRSRTCDLGMSDRVRFTGPLTGTRLSDAYAAADVLVLPSRSETYGMVVTEALARALPVVASRVGGVPEALGRCADATRPGMLLPPGDPRALAGALRRWLTDEGHRQGLRTAARQRRPALTRWSTSADRMSCLLGAVAGEPSTVRARTTR